MATSVPTVVGTRAYVVGAPNLCAIDTVTKATLWTKNGTYSGQVAVAGGSVYATSAGSLTVRDASTGALVWFFADDGKLSFPPVIGAGQVYVASHDNVYAIASS